MRSRRTVPDRENGIVVSLKIDNSFEGDTIGLWVYLAGINNFHYLNSWELTLSYDSLAFGTYLAKKGKVLLSDERYLIKQLATHYERNFTDENANTIKFSWKRKQGLKDYFEISSLGYDDFKGIPILKMKVPVSDITKPMHLKLNFPKNPIAQDIPENKPYEISFQHTDETIINPFENYKKPIINDFYPQKADIGDTITLEGVHFTKAIPLLYGKSFAGRSFFKPVHKKFIVTQSDDKMVFIIPPFMQQKTFKKGRTYRDMDAYVPISNYIYLDKSDVYESGRTKEKLIIK